MPKRSRKTPRTVHMTKHQASRAERERQQKYYVYAAVAAVIAILVLIPVIGWWREVVTKGDQAYADVLGETITIGTYAKVLGFRQFQINRQGQALNEQLSALPKPTPTAEGAPSPTPRPTLAPGQTSPPAPTPSDPQLVQLQQQYQRLQFEQYGLEDRVKDELVHDIIIRQELAHRGVTISSTETDQLIINDPDFSYSKEEAQAQAKQSGLSWEEFRRLIAEPGARRQKFDKILSDDVKPVAEQVHIRHILLTTQEEADKALVRLQAGEQFATLAAEISTDAKTKDKQGDLGWFPRGFLSQEYSQEFETAAFSAAAGAAPKQAVQTSFGYHLIMVDEYAQSREIDPAQLSTLRSNAFDRWLAEATTSVDDLKVTMQYTADKKKWVDQYLSKLKN
jgi:peptidyl-prolyl cis-trans isomerase C